MKTVEKPTPTERLIIRKIYKLQREGKEPRNKDIVNITGYSKSMVSELITELIKYGALSRNEKNVISVNEFGYDLIFNDMEEQLQKIVSLMEDYEIKKVETNKRVTISEEAFKKFDLKDKKTFKYKTENKTETKQKTPSKPKAPPKPNEKPKESQKSKLARFFGW